MSLNERKEKISGHLRQPLTSLKLKKKFLFHKISCDAHFQLKTPSPSNCYRTQISLKLLDLVWRLYGSALFNFIRRQNLSPNVSLIFGRMFVFKTCIGKNILIWLWWWRNNSRRRSKCVIQWKKTRGDVIFENRRQLRSWKRNINSVP